MIGDGGHARYVGSTSALMNMTTTTSAASGRANTFLRTSHMNSTAATNAISRYANE